MKAILDEPFRSRFVELVKSGAGLQDIHPAGHVNAHEPRDAVRNDFITRELDRVELHLRMLVPLLVPHAGAPRRILDVGCSTGGTTAALSLAPEFSGAEVIGVDPSHRAIEAAKVRACGLELTNRTRFQTIVAGDPLPFADGSFDLVVSVSVLEFVPGEFRSLFLSELERVTRPGGVLYISTPAPMRPREVHTGRWLGNYRRSIEHPWAWSAGRISACLPGSRRESLSPILINMMCKRFAQRVPSFLARPLARVALPFGRWQKLLFRKIS